jgi:hypothetical protein
MMASAIKPAVSVNSYSSLVMKIPLYLQRRLFWLNLPSTILIALLQRTPVLRVLAVADEMVIVSPLGTMLRSAFVGATSLGVMHTLAGATELATSQTSPASATVGTPVTFAFSITGTLSPPESWTANGSVPPGLSFSGSNTDTLILSGTPTMAGSYVVTVQAHNDAPALSTSIYSYTISVTAGASTAPAITTQPASQSVSVGANVTFTAVASGSPAPTYQWRQNGSNIAGATNASLSLNNVQSGDAGSYTVVVTNNAGSDTSHVATLTVAVAPAVPVFTTQPVGQTAALGTSVTFTAVASSSPAPTYQWQKSGAAITGATGASHTVNNVQPADAGLYTVIATTPTGTTTSAPAILAPVTTQKVVGAANELGANIRHPNGRYYDQLLLTGSAATFTADAGQVTRISYLDLNDDIVQVEFSGAGSVTLVLDTPSGPAAPVSYNQAVNYMKGHGSVYLADTDSSSYISAFTVGRMTAFDPTGGYDISKAVSATNLPANNGNPLFQPTTAYDGVADLGLLAITSASNTFGGALTANTSYWQDRGYTGIYAPGVLFADGRVYLHDLTAFGTATPEIQVGSASNVRVTGGNLRQDNNRAVQVSGFTSIFFAAGTDSHGKLLPAQANQARLEENGVDVTAQRVTGGLP